MRVNRISALTGKSHTMEIPATEDQFLLWRNGMDIQQAMPQCTPEQREFVMTGITPEEWSEQAAKLQKLAEEAAAAQVVDDAPVTTSTSRKSQNT